MCGSEIFKDEIALISNAELAHSVHKFLDTIVPKYFFEVPASSSGNYHPRYSLGYGGLVRHTKAAVRIAEDLLRLEQNIDLPHDTIIAALILHDSFKHGKDAGHTVSNHPILAAVAMENFAPTVWAPMEFLEAAELVRTHMGQWNTDKDGNKIMPKPETAAQKFVHLCDYLASRRYITVEVV